MAVETLYRSSRDPESLFMDRKTADAHDQMLEIAHGLAGALEKHIPGLSEQHAEEIGLFLAKNRSVFAAAFKNNPAALAELAQPQATVSE